MRSARSRPLAIAIDLFAFRLFLSVAFQAPNAIKIKKMVPRASAKPSASPMYVRNSRIMRPPRLRTLYAWPHHGPEIRQLICGCAVGITGKWRKMCLIDTLPDMSQRCARLACWCCAWHGRREVRRRPDQYRGLLMRRRVPNCLPIN